MCDNEQLSLKAWKSLRSVTLRGGEAPEPLGNDE